jgi:Uma2 family endonuclease
MEVAAVSTASKRLVSPEEYLRQERLADFKSEYLRGEVFAMSGASYAHVLINNNLAREVGVQLRDSPCRVLTNDMRVKISSAGLYTYPDVVIVCESPQFEDKVFDTLLNPRVIIEVLSDSTEKYDRGRKFEHYRQMASFQEYVLVAQDRVSVERHVRQADGNWLTSFLDDLAGTFELASVPVRIPLAEVYRDVPFPQPPTFSG